MLPTELVTLTALMERTSGIPEVKIGLVDGPVVTQHSDLAGVALREIPGNNGATCTQAHSMACLHGTFIAGILSAKRNSPAPAICPGCTLLVRPIFTETPVGREHMPSATPQDLAAAILECGAGARVINLSVALAQPSTKGSNCYHMIGVINQGDGTVQPAQNGSDDTFCLTSCFRACIESGGSGFQCILECRNECNPQPTCGRCIGFRQCSDGSQRSCSTP